MLLPAELGLDFAVQPRLFSEAVIEAVAKGYTDRCNVDHLFVSASIILIPVHPKHPRSLHHLFFAQADCASCACS